MEELAEPLTIKYMSVGALPLDSIDNDDVLTEKTFVSSKKLKPIYRSANNNIENISIKLDKSYFYSSIEAVESSTFEET